MFVCEFSFVFLKKTKTKTWIKYPFKYLFIGECASLYTFSQMSSKLLAVLLLRQRERKSLPTKNNYNYR